MFLRFAMCLTGSLWLSAQNGQPIPFDSPRWSIFQGKAVEHLGRSAFMGVALVNDSVLKDGVVEFDLAVTGARAFPGVTFRWASQGNLERVYFRPHHVSQARTGDVVQYLPMFHGVDAWQIYNGEGFTAPADLPPNQWVHVRIAFKGSQGCVYLGDRAKPALVMPYLQRDPIAGKVGIFIPPDGSAYIANFSYTADDRITIPAAPPRWSPPGLVRDWQVSPAVPFQQLEEGVYPAQPLTWRPIQADETGKVDLGRLGPLPSPLASRVYVKTTLHADKAGVRRIRLGYSDAATVFLNGTPVFARDRSYRSETPSFLGVLGLFDTLYLPLRAGDNELMLQLTESMGGWGVMAQNLDAPQEAVGVTAAWDTGMIFDAPESAAYDPKRKRLYISNHGGGLPGERAISTLGLDGKIQEPRWVQGLQTPAGLRVQGDTLLVAERRGLAEIDIPTASLRKLHPVPGAVALNDPAVDCEGTWYVSDPPRATVWRIKGGKADAFLEGPEFQGANGLLVQGDILWIACMGDGCLKSVDLATRRVTRVIPVAKGMLDGLESDGRGGLLVTQHEGRLFRVDAEGRIACLVDSVSEGATLADLAYLPEEGLAVCPTLFGMRVKAYRLPR